MLSSIDSIVFLHMHLKQMISCPGLSNTTFGVWHLLKYEHLKTKLERCKFYDSIVLNYSQLFSEIKLGV